jgi:hypothetical protein
MIELDRAKLNITKPPDSCSPRGALNPFEYSKGDQAKYIAIGLASSACLIVARMLQPSSRGVGTHEQLGLPPCVFLHLTGIPCPSCGLTTSVAHAARFHFYESITTQPFGIVIFISAALCIPLSIFLWRRRIPWSRLKSSLGGNLVIYLTIALFILSWLYKIAAMKGLFWRG